MNNDHNIPGGEGLPEKRQEFFPAPDGYFDSFTDQLSQRIEAEELKSTAPFLFSLEKIELFSAPEGYFDRFTVALRDAINKADQKIFFGLFTKWQFAFSLSSVVAVLIVSFFILRNPSVETVELADVPQQEINSFVSNEIETISTEELEEYIDEDELAMNTKIIDAEDEELESYIMEEIDLHDMIEEL